MKHWNAVEHACIHLTMDADRDRKMRRREDVFHDRERIFLCLRQHYITFIFIYHVSMRESGYIHPFLHFSLTTDSLDVFGIIHAFGRPIVPHKITCWAVGVKNRLCLCINLSVLSQTWGSHAQESHTREALGQEHFGAAQSPPAECRDLWVAKSSGVWTLCSACSLQLLLLDVDGGLEVGVYACWTRVCSLAWDAVHCLLLQRCGDGNAAHPCLLFYSSLQGPSWMRVYFFFRHLQMKMLSK